MWSDLKKNLTQQSDVLLVLSMVGILMILFTPIPSALLDVLIITNFSFGLLILLLCFYVEKPLKFSTFPSLLLIATLFRLSLNIAATRLILNDANAGQVINAIGKHVVAGNYVIGLIVFIVLIVVQYVVVTSGAQRVAEVAARFTLDSMPGKQMAIDADMNIGIIDEKEAQKRRKEIEKEGSFYGAMDGASKFVKGDAIAGIIIILIDIIGGLTIGVAQLGMPWGEALHTYTLLTVGDGIVTQIPALIIATGTGIIVTRAASDEFLSKEISRQITAYPKALMMIFIGLLLTLLIPGIPAIPTLAVLSIIGLLTFYTFNRARNEGSESSEPETDSTNKDNELSELYKELKVDPFKIEIGQQLTGLAEGADSLLMDRITYHRKQFALDSGFVIPPINVHENPRLGDNEYRVYVYGVSAGIGQLYPDKVLAINPGNIDTTVDGIHTKDPSFGLDAVWVDKSTEQAVIEKGFTVVEAETILSTHLGELFKQQAFNLLSRAETERLLERLKLTHASLVDDLVPNILTISDVQKILQLLLKENISILNLEQILETLLEHGKEIKDHGLLAELIRQKLGGAICQKLTDKQDTLYVLVLDPNIEQTIKTNVNNNTPLDIRFSEQLVSRLASHVEEMMVNNKTPVLLCAAELRRYIKQLTQRNLTHLNVISMSEVPNNIKIKSNAIVTI